MGRGGPLREGDLRRRQFLKGSLVLAGLAATGCPAHRTEDNPGLGGGRVDPDFISGHRLRDGEVPTEVATERRCQAVILGGGISGLSAGWRFKHAGLTDFQLLELETTVGGNSRALTYDPSKAPIGAHYLPIPNLEARAVRRVLEEMGVLGPEGLDPRHLCHSPQERLFDAGSWHQGLLPPALFDEVGAQQVEAFLTHIQQWRERRDSQGRKVFALPLHYSSREPEFLELDKESFASYVQRQQWSEPLLLWYLEYACRDDFGGSLEDCSAWAGLHYFASRDGGGLGHSDDVLVWPEGNQRLAAHLASGLESQITSGSLVLGVQSSQAGVSVDYLEVASGMRHRVHSQTVVCCLPTFVRSRLFGQEFPSFEYPPWLTANLVMSTAPEDIQGHGFIAWDNVIRGSESLGYVVATHQNLAQDPRRPTVWTWYRPFVDESPTEVRKKLLEARWEDWAETILAELEPLHGNIRQLCRQLDVTILGHGMVRPSPGLIWGEEMERARQSVGSVFFGHGDLSGMSLFEESQFRGVKAAEDALAHLGRPVETFL